MRIAVMGAGAVGCYYGAMLARNGHEVTLIGRATHAEAVNQAGLFLETAAFRQHVPMAATTEPDGVAGAELVLFCVKSPDSESAGAAIAPYLGADALVFSLQNGVDNAARLQAILSRTVVPAVVYVACEMAGPGHVKHHGRGELVMGPFAGSEGVIEAFSAAGVPTTVSENVQGALWAKLILNCAYNAMSAIAQLPYGVLSAADGVTAVMRDVVSECLEVAARAGVEVPGDIRQTVLGLAATMPNQYSSTAQDLARGKKSEIDFLNGIIVRQGEALGVATPANRVLHTMVKLLESKAASSE